MNNRQIAPGVFVTGPLNEIRMSPDVIRSRLARGLSVAPRVVPDSWNGHRYHYNPSAQSVQFAGIALGALVSMHYCSLCAWSHRRASRDGAADCRHKQLLRQLIAADNGS